jgi:Rrf2 family protein
MNLSSKTQYACLAMFELAQQHSLGEPVQVRRIAERHGIPSPFLVQILQDLKRAGLVTSVRGAAGGYLLAQSPEELTLAELLDAVEGPQDTACCAAGESALAPVLTEVCLELAAVRRERLEAITLADLVDRAAVGSGEMWYI